MRRLGLPPLKLLLLLCLSGPQSNASGAIWTFQRLHEGAAVVVDHEGGGTEPSINDIDAAVYTLGSTIAGTSSPAGLPNITSVLVPRLEHHPLATRLGEGIVIYASGNRPRYAHGAVVLVESLRAPSSVNGGKPLSSLPVELFYGCEKEAFPESLRHRLDDCDSVEVRSLSNSYVGALSSAVTSTNDDNGWSVCTVLPAYGRKVLAAIVSSFERLVLFDADVIPLVDPAKMFELPAFRQSGMVLFGDYVPLGTFFNDHQRLFDFLDLDVAEYHRLFRGQEADSSGVVLDKGFVSSAGETTKHVVWAALHIALAMNAMNESYYRAPPPPEPVTNGFVYGDKDTWALAALKAGVPLSPPPLPPAALAVDIERQREGAQKRDQAAPVLGLEYQRLELLHYWELSNPTMVRGDLEGSDAGGGSSPRPCPYQLLEGHLQRAEFPDESGSMQLVPLFLNAQSELFGALTYFQLAHTGPGRDSVFVRSFHGGANEQLHYKLCDSLEAAARAKNDVLAPEAAARIRNATEAYSRLTEASHMKGRAAGEVRVVTVEHDFRLRPSLGVAIREHHSGVVFVTNTAPGADPQIATGMVLLSVGRENCVGVGLESAAALLQAQAGEGAAGVSVSVSFAFWSPTSRFRSQWR